MKNMKKFAAGFIAAAMAMSMSLSAFAEVVAPTISDDKATLNIGTGITTVNGDQTTMMAYVVPGILADDAEVPDYDATAHEMVALDQVDGETGIASVPVDASKLADGNTIVVKISGTDGNLATYLITMEEETVETYSVTYVLNDGTVTGENPNTFDADDTIAAFIGALVAPTKVDTTGAYTYTFAGWATTADGTAIDTTDETALMTSLLAEGETSITLYALYTETATKKYYLGDVNGDGKITLKDYNDILLKVRRKTPENPVGETFTTASGTEFVLGDVNGDEKITLKDYNDVLLKVRRKTPENPVGEEIK